MKTFYELGTMPQVGDLIMKVNGDGWGNPVIFMVTAINDRTYHVSKQGLSIHWRHLATYYAPLGQKTQ